MKHKPQDAIEHIVQGCKADLDVPFDSAPSWDIIAAQLDAQATKRKQGGGSPMIIRLWSKVGGVAAILVLGFLLGRFFVPSTGTAEAPAALAEIKNHYEAEVTEHITLVKGYDPNHSIIDEIKLLDEQIEILEKDYINATDLQKEYILESMISNYQTRVNLLQTVINKINTHKNDQYIEI